MKVLHTVEDAQATCAQIKREGRTLALVPTMGALHAGHLSLVRAARAQCDEVAVSIFVNPLQFGPNEDFDRYPRVLERDCELLEAEGASLVFAPSPEAMYGAGPTTFVEVPELPKKLEGKTRPTHFRGVTTVVSKLFHIIQPDIAFFGQKDAQQVAIIRRMVRDLNFPLQIDVCPIVRENDGPALSSRNAYMDPKHRHAATVLYRALMRIQTLVDKGECSAAKLAEVGRAVIAEEPLAKLDYLEIVDPETLDPIDDVCKGALVLEAVYLGNTRLIDNLLLSGVGEAAGPDLQ